MDSHDFASVLVRTVGELSEPESLKGLFHERGEGDARPSGKALREIIELCRTVIFPGYYGKSTVNRHTLPYHIGVSIERLHALLGEQILAGLCFDAARRDDAQRDRAADLSAQFIAKLPSLRKILATDVESTYNGDPAAQSYGEIISCYPVMKALCNYRIAHELLLLGVPLIPRIITEMAHSETGIDIHPAASIGHHFTIDHGTGVVIGATSVIGNHVMLYQGVTLGARNFPLGPDGNPIKGIPRHPILEDHVVVYSNATILGRITIGRGATIGGNIWVTDNVPPGAHLVQHKYK